MLFLLLFLIVIHRMNSVHKTEMFHFKCTSQVFFILLWRRVPIISLSAIYPKPTNLSVDQLMEMGVPNQEVRAAGGRLITGCNNRGGQMVMELTKKGGNPQPRQPFAGVADTNHWLVNATGLFWKGVINYRKHT